MPSLRNSLSGDSDVNIKVSTTSDNKGIEETKTGLKGMGAQADDTGSKFSGMSTVAKVAVAAIGTAVLAAGRTFVQSAADLQQTSKSFEVLTGNVQVANELFAKLATYANSTPFEFPDIAKAGQTLLGFGIESDKVFDKITILGDIAAATGANFSSLALVFGQVNATGKLMGQDALQLINNSIPIYNILAKKMGIETGKVKEQIEKGAVSVDIFNEALADVTKEGGFAFKGVDTLAQSFNGRMSTLNDSILDFGRNLIGVKVDPELGLVIEEGGLFDRLSDLIPKIAEGLSGLAPTLSVVTGGIAGFAGVIAEAAGQIAEYLSPKLDALWKSIGDDLMPALQDLWHNVIEPLIPVIGTSLVFAIGAVVDTLTFLVQSFGYVYEKLKEGDPLWWGVIGVIGAVATALTMNAAFNAFNTGMSIITATTIPSVMAKFTAMSALVTSPITMPAILVGAAIAALVMVFDQAMKTWEAIDSANEAAKSGQDSEIAAHKQLYELRKNGTPEQKARAIETGRRLGVPGFATGVRNFEGGMAVVGEHGAELVQLPQGSNVYSNGESKQMTSGGSGQIIIHNVNLNTDSAVRAFFDINDRDAQMAAMRLTPSRGQS